MNDLTIEGRSRILKDFDFSRTSLLRGMDPKRNRIFRGFVLSEGANPHAADNVEMTAYVAFGDYPQIKYIAALGTLIGAEHEELLIGIEILVVPTSGNFGLAVAVFATAFGIRTVMIIIKKDTVPQKVIMMTAPPSAEIVMIQSGKGFPTVLERAEREARQLPRSCLLDQFRGTLSLWNAAAHFTWTGPDLMRAAVEATGKRPRVLVGMGGTCGTMRGIKDHCLASGIEIECILASVAVGHELPGGRDWTQIQRDGGTLVLEDLLVGNTPYEAERNESMQAMFTLGAEMAIGPGATSAGAYIATLKYLAARKAAGTLDELRDEKDGKIRVGFICPDSSATHVDRVTATVNYERSL